MMAGSELMVTLKFFRWQELYMTEKSFQIFMDIPEDAQDKRASNVEFEDVVVSVHDERGKDKDFDLDSNGFDLLNIHRV